MPDKTNTSTNGVLTVCRLFSSAEMSVALIVLDGINQKVLNQTSTARYHVWAGHGCFIVWQGEKHVVREVKPGDVVIVPPNTPYQDFGRNLIMVSVNHPAFDSNKVVVLDK